MKKEKSEWVKEYSIETIKDIVDNVPLEKLDLFLQDLKIFITEAKQFNKIASKLPKVLRDNIKLDMKRVDDGEVWLRGAEVNIKIQ
jgi:hypothetical protein